MASRGFGTAFRLVGNRAHELFRQHPGRLQVGPGCLLQEPLHSPFGHYKTHELVCLYLPREQNVVAVGVSHRRHNGRCRRWMGLKVRVCGRRTCKPNSFGGFFQPIVSAGLNLQRHAWHGDSWSLHSLANPIMSRSTPHRPAAKWPLNQAKRVRRGEPPRACAMTHISPAGRKDRDASLLLKMIIRLKSETHLQTNAGRSETVSANF